MNASRKTLGATAVCALVLSGASAAQAGPAASTLTTVTTHHTSLGRVVSNKTGHTVYLFEKDKKNDSYCYGRCAKVWKPLTTKGEPVAGNGIKQALLGRTKRDSGTFQVTYNGHPLYTYVHDKKAGTAHGEGVKQFGDDWYAVSRAGHKIDNS